VLEFGQGTLGVITWCHSKTHLFLKNYLINQGVAEMENESCQPHQKNEKPATQVAGFFIGESDLFAS
jgi:hypothetical protein